MLDSLFDVFTLFMRGKLFRDFGNVVQQTLIANFLAAVILIVLAKSGIPLWADISVASVVAGAMQPWLLKDIRFA
jgi:hypothetical protein